MATLLYSYLSIAYGKHAKCFMGFGCYTKALIDLHLAEKYKHVSDDINKTHEDDRLKCEKILMSSEFAQVVANHAPPLKMKLKRNHDFPCMAQAIEIRENEKYGRHIVAKEDIDKGTIVMYTSPFAVTTNTTKSSACRLCSKVQKMCRNNEKNDFG